MGLAYEVCVLLEVPHASISIETVRVILNEAGITYQLTKTWKASNDPEFETKKRIESLCHQPPIDGRIICFDEFGPLAIQPFSGQGWFKKAHLARFPAAYHRNQHLLAALDLKDDKLWSYFEA